MTDPSVNPTPPEGLPDELVTYLHELSAEELRKTVIHAQELLLSKDETDDPIHPHPNEDIIRVTEHEGYTEVVKQFTCAEGCEDCPHGPYLYHVTEEPRPDGSTHTHWSFIGRVKPDDE